MRYARVCDRNQHRARALCYPHPHTAATTSWSISRANAGPGPVPSPSGVLHQAIRGMRRLIKGAAERAKPCDHDDNASSRASMPARRRAGAAAVLPASAPQRAGKAEARHSAVGATVHCWSIASWLLPSPYDRGSSPHLQHDPGISIQEVTSCNHTAESSAWSSASSHTESLSSA